MESVYKSTNGAVKTGRAEFRLAIACDSSIARHVPIAVATTRRVGCNARMNNTRTKPSGTIFVAASGAMLFAATLLPGCIAHADETPTTKPAVDATLEQPDKPTAKDLADMAEFDRLAALLDGGRGTETLNLLRDSSQAARDWAGGSADNPPPLALKRLAGKEPANKRHLIEARGILSWNLKRLQVTEKLVPPGPIDIVKRHGEIKIDGKLDEAEWKRAPAIPINFLFKLINTDADPKHLTNARMLWDEEGLYIGYRVHDTTVHAGPGKGDDMSYLWDCVEVFILVDPKELIYWELNILASGAVNDVYCKKNARLWAGDRDLDAKLEGLKFAYTILGTPDVDTDVDEGYIVEVFIPWKGLRSLRQPPVTGSELKGVLAQADMKTPVKPANLSFYSDVPMIIGYQDVWNFRTWKFVDRK
jgi:hypothetical protein